jgi:hypothetical protein
MRFAQAISDFADIDCETAFGHQIGATIRKAGQYISVPSALPVAIR